MNELTVLPPRELTPSAWKLIMEMAPVIHESRMFGVASPAAAAAIMLKGYDLGLSMTAAFEFVQVVQGKPGLSPRGALAILHNHPEITKLEINRLADQTGKFQGYECTIARRNGFTHTSRFTLEDAKRAGLIKAGSAWEAYPENLAMWRAVGFAADVVAPDLIAGMSGLMKAPERQNVDLTESGDVIDGSYSVRPSAPIPADPHLTLDQLCDTFGAEKIFSVNGGRLPESQAEIDTLALKLASEAQ